MTDRAYREKNAMDRLQEQIMAWAEEKGWNQGEDERSFGDWMALLHSEISGAYEDYRNHHTTNEVYYEYNGEKITADNLEWFKTQYPDALLKPCGIPIEMADLAIRMLHLAASSDFNLYNMIELKMRYNQQRAYRHGGKKV